MHLITAHARWGFLLGIRELHAFSFRAISAFIGYIPSSPGDQHLPIDIKLAIMGGRGGGGGGRDSTRARL